MDSIGVQGGSIPGLAPGGMVPTILLGDLSRNFAAEVFEKRGIVGAQLNSSLPGYMGIAQLASRAPGGCVLEQLRSYIDIPGTNGRVAWEFAVSTTAPALASVSSVDPLPIGGGTPNSTFKRGQVTGTPFAGMPSQVVFDLWDLQGVVIWVPPGNFFTIMCLSWNTTGTIVSSNIELTWREIPEIQGVAE